MVLFVQSFNQQQHPTHAGGPVYQAHQETELHCGQRGLDGSLYKQGQPGKSKTLKQSS